MTCNFMYAPVLLSKNILTTRNAISQNAGTLQQACDKPVHAPLRRMDPATGNSDPSWEVLRSQVPHADNGLPNGPWLRLCPDLWAGCRLGEEPVCSRRRDHRVRWKRVPPHLLSFHHIWRGECRFSTSSANFSTFALCGRLLAGKKKQEPET